MFVIMFDIYFIFCGVIFWRSVFAENPNTDPPLSSYEVVMSWGQIDYKFASPEERQQRINRSEFIPKNNIITGIKVTGNRVFLVVPRWREGVPATLVYVQFDPRSTTSNSKQQQANSLVPYPSWDAQEIGNCVAFQYAQSIETDPFNRLWIVDTGVHNATPTLPRCPPKLVIMDLATDSILVTYKFPPQVVLPNKNLLTNLVVECPQLTVPDNCWAYIADSVGAQIVVFYLKTKQSWSVRHSSMKATTSAGTITILGHTHSLHTNINGLALSPFDESFDNIYYCPLSSYFLYSISTKTMKLASSSGPVHDLSDEETKYIGTRFSQSDGLTMDSKGLLFYGVLSSNAINYWNSTERVLNPKNEVLLVQNDIDLQWADSFSFDDTGYLYVTTNRIQRSLTNSYDMNDVNFRIIRIYVGSKSYQHSASEALSNDTGVGDVSDKTKYDPNADTRNYAGTAQAAREISNNVSIPLLLIFLILRIIFQ